MFCTECGEEIEEGTHFCPYCGKPQEPGATAPQEPVPPARATTPPVPVTPPVAQTAVPAAAQPRQRKKWLIPVAAGGAAVLVAGIVLVLVLVVFKGSSGPEATMRDFFKALQSKKVESVLALVDLEGIKQKGMLQEFEASIKGGLPSDDMKFEDLEFTTKIDGDQATVKIVSGKAVTTDAKGKESTADMTAGSNAPAYLVLKNGKWLIAETTFAEFYAEQYLEEADAALDKLKADADKAGADIENIFVDLGTGVTNFTELDAQYKQMAAQAKAPMDAIKKKAPSVKSTYDPVLQLEGAQKYKDYAEIRQKQVDDIAKTVDTFNALLDELGGYISGLAASPPTTQEAVAAIEQTVAGIEARYTAEIDSLEQDYTDLEGQAEALKKDLDL